MKKQKLRDIASMNSAITWSVHGWEAKADTLMDALWVEVSYRECLAYQIFQLIWDEEANREFCLQNLKEELEREPTEDEINRACWDQEDFEWGHYVDEIKATKTDEELLEAAGLVWEDVSIIHIDCSASYCGGEVQPHDACPGCHEAFCLEHYDEEEGCPGCGYRPSSVDFMAASIEAG